MRARTFLIGVFSALMLVSMGRGYFAYRSFHATIAQFDEIALRRERAAQAVDRVQAMAIDLETGVRGFLVTKDHAFLSPYTKAEAEQRVVLDELLARAPNTPEAQVWAQRVQKDVSEWIDTVGRPLTDPKVFTLSEEERYERNADGKRRMDRIRVDLEALRGIVQKLQAEQRAGLSTFEDELVRDQIALTLSIMALMVAIALLAMRQIEAPLDRLVSFAEGGRVTTKDLLALTGVREVRVLGRSLAELHTRLEEDRARELRFTELVTALAEGGSLAKVAQVGLRAIVEDQACLFGILWLDTPDGLRRVASVGIDANDQQPDALVNEALQTNKLVRVDDVDQQKSHVLRTAAVDIVPSTIVASPITIAGRFVGIIELGGTLPKERIAVLDRFLQRIALALENAAANDKTAELGQRLAGANEELASQNEELRVQEEELVAQREELLSKQATLTLRTDELARASRAKSDFLSTMSHELRTPLNAVIGFSDVLLANGAGELSGVQRRHVADIEGAARQLLGLVNDLLDLAKVEAGHMDLQLVDVDVREPITAAVQLLRPAAGAKDISIATLLPANVEIHADPARVRQIMVNLLSNAVKFTPREGRVDVVVKATNDVVRIAVTDTGPGIRHEEVARVFQPFAQLEAGIASRTGTGLGLSISRQLVEAMGGTIAFEPGPKGGTTFYFTLPKRRGGVHVPMTSTTSTTVTRTVSVLPRTVAPPDDSAERVLVVMGTEDEALVARDLLLRAGHHAETSSSFEAARSALGSSRFGLLVVDLDASGAFDFVREVRSSQATRGAAIVGLATGDLPPPLHRELTSLGVFLVQKGVMTDRGFVDGIQGLLARRKHAVVLVIDDNTTNRRVARAMLESASMEVLEADSAEAGLEIARTSRPDVVLMDIRMPGMDGLDATRAIRRDPNLDGIPVIALSAQAMVGDAERALDAGCVAYVTKPVSRRELLEAISSALGSRAHPKA
ncbi:GAF sensor hybrid histidine kinase [Labilithrix luteola]|uniref:histidine kinase n=1 Tax=Labilithrix luteola TaxID=1391654 RepID=A0A0K1PJ60_9BACT|nr:response regulator [Labilithrix luteola]AKU93436.1 GAF sensor hybrid histidine kinase [Labilithrix luteola]